MKRNVLRVALLIFGVMSLSAFVAQADPPTDQRTTLYVCKKEPLLTTPLIKLPITSITPKGWLRHQLDYSTGADGTS